MTTTTYEVYFVPAAALKRKPIQLALSPDELREFIDTWATHEAEHETGVLPIVVAKGGAA